MTSFHTPDTPGPEEFDTAEAAVARLQELYATATEFLCSRFVDVLQTGAPPHRIRAFYPEIRLTTSSFAQIDTRLSFGHVAEPGTYTATITRPDLFRNYLLQQIALLIRNHARPVTIGPSNTPIPLHFAVANDASISVPQEGATDFILRDVFDVPDLTTTNDDIVNGTYKPADGTGPLAPFTAQRIDYSLARLSHYTATDQ